MPVIEILHPAALDDEEVDGSEALFTPESASRLNVAIESTLEALGHVLKEYAMPIERNESVLLDKLISTEANYLRHTRKMVAFRSKLLSIRKKHAGRDGGDLRKCRSHQLKSMYYSLALANTELDELLSTSNLHAYRKRKRQLNSQSSPPPTLPVAPSAPNE